MGISEISNSVKEYMGMFTAPISDIAFVLMSVTEKYGADIYLNEQKLKEAMREFGADEIQIAKVILMTHAAGFQELLESTAQVQQNDLERYMQNAVKELGFNRTQVLEMAAALAMSLGIAFECKIIESKEKPHDMAFVIPASLYEDELQRIDELKDMELSPEDLTRLEVLASAGIPKAKYYLGTYLLKHEEFEKNYSLGLQLLEEAASEGNSPAAGALGDYYYERESSEGWQMAYEYYTGYGTLALNEERRNAVLNIINHKTFNRKMLGVSVILAALALALLILAPGTAVYAAHRVIGSICFIGMIAVLAVAFMHYRVKPYDSVYWVPCSMFMIWFFYAAVRIIF